MKIQSAKKRIVLDFNEEAADNIDKLKDRLGFKTRTDLIRHALALLDMADEKKREGYKLQFKKGHSILELATLF